MGGRGCKEAVVSCFLIADDNLIFIEAHKNWTLYLSRVLIWFGPISKLRINLEMSELIFIRYHTYEGIGGRIRLRS